MKTRTTILYLAFVFCFHGYGQKNDLQRNNLNGNVKSIREFNYVAVDSNGIIRRGELQYSFYNTFNMQGNKVDDIKYKPDGKTDKSYIYKYDNAGRRIEQKQVNAAGNLVRRITYRYDAQGNLIEDNSFDASGKFEKKYLYGYDNKRNVIEDESYDTSHTLLKRFTYKYDDSGNKIENDQYATEGKPDKRIYYKYDNHRNVTEETVASPDNTRVIYLYTYEYDGKDNWIKKNKFLEKKPVSITERKIEYY